MELTRPYGQEHPWVTKSGIDPLLPAEENCAELVEPPNELELNRAFTRKMNHLFYVVCFSPATELRNTSLILNKFVTDESDSQIPGDSHEI